MLRLIKICVAVFISVFAFSSINANESVSAVAVSLSLIQNGGFEEADFSGNYTLNISKATGWGSNNTSDGNSLSGVSGNGVAKTGEYSLGLPGATLGYFTDINARSGNNFAFLLTRKSGGALAANYIESSPFSVSQSGLYEFSCGLKNGTKDHGRGATIAIEIVQGQETVSTYSYTIPVAGQDWHLVENQVDLQPGEYFVRFKVIKEGTTENKDQARVCIDDVGLRRYLAAADIFNAGTEDGYTVDLTDHLILDGEQSYCLAEGKKLTIDAKGFSIKGKITVNGELTLVNGDFSGCVFSGSGKVSAPAVAVSPLSLIQNGGFEEADFSGNYTLNISKATGWGQITRAMETVCRV